MVLFTTDGCCANCVELMCPQITQKNVSNCKTLLKLHFVPQLVANGSICSVALGTQLYWGFFAKKLLTYAANQNT